MNTPIYAFPSAFSMKFPTSSIDSGTSGLGTRPRMGSATSVVTPLAASMETGAADEGIAPCVDGRDERLRGIQ